VAGLVDSTWGVKEARILETNKEKSYSYLQKNIFVYITVQVSYKGGQSIGHCRTVQKEFSEIDY
jgi:hypothetical protein